MAEEDGVEWLLSSREVELILLSLAGPILVVAFAAILSPEDRGTVRELVRPVLERTAVSLVGFALGWLALARWSSAVPGCAPGGDCATTCYTVYGVSVPCTGWWDVLAIVAGFAGAILANLLWSHLWWASKPRSDDHAPSTSRPRVR